MPRRASSASESNTTGTTGTTVTDRPAPALVEPRPGAEIRPDIVNVFEEGVSAGAASGLRLAPLGGRKAGDAIALSVRAWVRNMAYDKDLWIDVSLAGDQGELLHAESVSLSFLEPAGGEGDFFTIGTAVPAPKPEEEPAPTLLYRLYGQLGGQLYTDGVLHRHPMATEAKATEAKATEAKAAAPVAKADAARASTKPTAEKVAEPAKPATPSRDTAKASTAKASTAKTDTTKTDTAKASAGKASTAKTDTAKASAGKASTAKTDTAKASTGKTTEKATPKAAEKPAGKSPTARKRTAPKD